MSTFVLLNLAAALATRAASIPAPSAWATLNTTVNGRLYSATPFARPCFKLANTTGSFDEAECAAVQSNYRDGDYLTGTFGAYLATQWETCQTTSEQCALDWVHPKDPAAFRPPVVCSQGSVPPHYIDVHEVSDVQAAFAFSKETGVPLAIKNTGHDYNGRSSMKGSLGLWMHNLNSMTYNAAFVPRGCSASSAVPGATLGAGTQFEHVFTFAETHNITLPGGACSTVGAAGGYLMGGGHSWLSNIYGLAVDRVLEFEVVTPTGEYLFANACQNEDLYFALRGGGGGTFGVVLGATMKALPQSAYTTVQLKFTANPITLPIFLSYLIKNGVQWAEDGWSGTFAPTSYLILNKLGIDTTRADAYFASLRPLAAKLRGNITITTYSSYMSWHNRIVTPNTNLPAGIPQTGVTRLIPATTLTDSPDALREAIIGLIPIAPEVLIFSNTPYSFKQDPALGEPSTTPAWRNAVWQITGGSGWLTGASPSVQSAVYKGLTKRMDALRAISPGSGAYQNEADLHEPDFTSSFWGSNYERLVSIKQKYDPDRLLDCWHCIDSSEDDDAFSCYL